MVKHEIFKSKEQFKQVKDLESKEEIMNELYYFVKTPGNWEKEQYAQKRRGMTSTFVKWTDSLHFDATYIFTVAEIELYRLQNMRLVKLEISDGDL